MIHITDYSCFHEQDYYAPGDTGAPVVTPNDTFPFLISDAGIDWVPVRVTEAGF